MTAKEFFGIFIRTLIFVAFIIGMFFLLVGCEARGKSDELQLTMVSSDGKVLTTYGLINYTNQLKEISHQLEIINTNLSVIVGYIERERGRTPEAKR